jgi:hypothetical protein
MKYYLILLFLFIIFLNYDYDFTENFSNINSSVIESSLLTLSEFNHKFNSNIIELPNNVCALGIDMDSENKMFLYLNSFVYISLINTTNYWIKNIHNKLNKRKYYILICYSDGYKFDEESDVKDFLSFRSKNQNNYIFTFCKRWNDNNSICIPDFYYTTDKKYLKHKTEIDSINIKWEDKKNICIWRGNVQNGYITNFFDSNNKFNLNQRKYFVKLHDEGQITNINYQNNEMSISDQLQYKYILDIDGWANTWDATIWKLYSGSVLLKVQSTWKQWYYDELKEWIHYVPINNDFSDLNLKIEWCKSNDDKCKEIVNNARNFVIEKIFDAEYVNNKIVESTLNYLSISNQ